MKRSNLNFLVDAFAFAMFVFLIATGLIMEFLLPAGSGHSTVIWGLDRHGWGDIHFWISVLFLTSLAIHLYLHWKWILHVVRGRPREGSGIRVGLGVFGLAALLMIAAAPLVSPVDRTREVQGAVLPRRTVNTEAEDIEGSMTLAEALHNTSITVDELVQQLGLPSNVSPDERLGRLARENGFSVADVREIVERGVSAADFGSHEEVDHPLISVSIGETLENDMPSDADGHEPPEIAEIHAGEHGTQQAGSAAIRGSMTLAEIVEKGIPCEYLIESLGLPSGIPSTERLGRLGRDYGFTMGQVRELVESYH